MLDEEVKRVLDERIRPLLQQDGGGIEFISIDRAGVVSVHLTGACGNCPGAQLTLQYGVKDILKTEVPGVTDVIAI